jgi:hypothetical protein
LHQAFLVFFVEEMQIGQPCPALLRRTRLGGFEYLHYASNVRSHRLDHSQNAFAAGSLTYVVASDE